MKKILAISLFFVCFIGVAQDIYLHCGKLVDTQNGKVLTDKTIVVSGTTIKEVKNGFVTPKNAEDRVVDLTKKTVMPGWIDMHVHIESETSPTQYIETFTLNDADKAYNAQEIAKRTLMAGFTTVRDLGGTGVNVALRNAIYKDKVIGPRIFTAEKSLATTGGHADPTNGRKKELMGDPGPKEGVVNSIEDAKKAVRQRYKNGADWIKITATGGVLSVAKNGANPQFFEDEIEAIVTIAADYNMKVAAHAHGDEGMQRAVRAGVKTIEHGTEMSDATMELMKVYDAYLVPTITAGKFVAEKAAIENYYPEVVVPKALAIGPQIQNTFAKAYKKGVPIAFGTDAGVFPHGENAKEFIYMTEVGMPAMEAIQSATVTNAELLDMQGKIGVLASGYFADIIATNDDPTEDINTVTNVVFVMKNGVIYKE